MDFHNVDIVLVGTLGSGNLGSVARAMCNMGLAHLKLVSPRCALDEQAFWMATCGEDVLKCAHVFPTLREAIADCSYCFGTTARHRRWRQTLSPRDAAQKTLGLCKTNRVAFVFGPEDSGLTNEELELCHEVITIPTVSSATSLNLSHAVMIICYELFMVTRQQPKTLRSTRLAPVAMTEAMYDHMRTTLFEIGFLNRQNPDYTLGLMRRILTKAKLTIPEARFIRGIFRQLAWYVKSREQKKEVNS
ncbi:MAG: RNA methyltransferase [Desulfobacterota bacterium]|nr:RNA methyltransferase [Thermodesulfobacteriota bacterium]